MIFNEFLCRNSVAFRMNVFMLMRVANEFFCFFGFSICVCKAFRLSQCWCVNQIRYLFYSFEFKIDFFLVSMHSNRVKWERSFVSWIETLFTINRFIFFFYFYFSSYLNRRKRMFKIYSLKLLHMLLLKINRFITQSQRQ